MCAHTCDAGVYMILAECESYGFVLLLCTPADAASQLPTEGVETRQLSADILPCSWAQLWGAGSTAEVQWGLGADGSWRGHPRGLWEAWRARGSGRRRRKAGGGPGRAGRRRGDGGTVAGGGRIGSRGGGCGRQVQSSHFPTDRRTKGELAAVDGRGCARGDGERRWRRKLADQSGGLAVQGVRSPRTLVSGEKKLQGPKRDGIRVDLRL